MARTINKNLITVFFYNMKTVTGGERRMATNKESAEQIVEAIGGKDNIAAATHCVTRLRFALKDEGKVNKEKLENIDVVKGSFSTNGQLIPGCHWTRPC